ncbi:MAG TPA: SMC-Scp complex subunit ScpB [Nitrospirales bacterium]|jgi:segregation and condensation protein B
MNTETGSAAIADHESLSARSHEDAGEAEPMTAPLIAGANGIKGIVEALLFVSGEPLTTDRLVLVIEGASRAEVQEAVKALQEDYAVDGRGLQIVEVAGGYQIVTRVECAAWIKRLEKAKTGAKLSRSAMETLAIIAYKQPLVRAEIEQIRGVDTAGVLRTLLDRRLLRIIGRKDIPGRPIMYGTSKQFLQAFGLKDLSDLPALRDLKDLGEPDQLVLPDSGDVTHSEPQEALNGQEVHG